MIVHGLLSLTAISKPFRYSSRSARSLTFTLRVLRFHS